VFGESGGRLFPIGFALAHGDERFALAAGGLQLFVDAVEGVELARDFHGAVEGRAIVEDEFAEDLIDAVDLLETGGPIEQGEGIFAHFEEGADLGEVVLFAGKETQSGGVTGVAGERRLAALVMQGEERVEGVGPVAGEKPGFLEIVGGIAGSIDPEQAADRDGGAAPGAGGAGGVGGGEAGDGFGRTGDVAVFLPRVFDPGHSPDVGDEVAVALVSAGGGEIVFRVGREQRHQRVYEGGLAAPGGTDDGGPARVDGTTMATVKRPPVEDVECRQQERGFTGADRRFSNGQGEQFELYFVGHLRLRSRRNEPHLRKIGAVSRGLDSRKGNVQQFSMGPNKKVGQRSFGLCHGSGSVSFLKTGGEGLCGTLCDRARQVEEGHPKILQVALN